VSYFSLGLSLGLDLVTAGLGLEAKNYGLGFGLVDVALALASYTYGLVNIPGCMQNAHYSILVFGWVDGGMGGISPFSGFVSIDFSVLM